MTQINYLNFDQLKYMGKWAGFIGIIQAIVWIGLAFMGIISYYCVYDYSSETVSQTKYGHATGWTFYHLYFKGQCDYKNLPYVNPHLLDANKQTLLDSHDVNVFMWVYIIISFFWLCSSISLITQIKKDKLKVTMIVLHLWIFITFATCVLDFVLGIIFGIDYSYFTGKAYEENFQDSKSAINPFGALFITSQIASISLMLIALRGFILWIINMSLVMYFTREILIINELDNDETKMLHKQFSSDSHSINSRPPINAFDTRNDVITIDPIVEENENNSEISSVKPIEQITIDNSNAIQRASLISNELLKERQSKFAQYEQYNPAANKPEIGKKPLKPQPYNYFNGNKPLTTDPRFPEPDYSPTPARKLNPVQKRNFS